MKRVLIYIALSALSAGTLLHAQNINQAVEQCAMNAGSDAVYLQDFLIEKPQYFNEGKLHPAKFTMLLKKNVRYRFTICKNESFTGKVILKLYDESRLMGTTYNPATGKEYPGFDFTCTKTGVYHLFIEFPEGQTGSAAAILSYVEPK